MDNFIDNPKAKEYLKKIRDAGFCGDGSFEDEVAGIEKYNNALRAKYAFEKMSNIVNNPNPRENPMAREIKQKMLKKCETELLNKHYNVLTVSQRDFVDKTFKGPVHEGVVRDGPMSEFYTELHGKIGSKTCYQEFEDFIRVRYPSGGYGLPIISYCSLLGIGKSHPFTPSHQNTRIKELEKKTKKLIENNKEIWDEMNLQDKRLKELEEENVGLIQNNDKNIELLISHKELMNIQNKRIDELEKKLSQSILTSSIMFASGIIIGVVGSWRLLSK